MGLSPSLVSWLYFCHVFPDTWTTKTEMKCVGFLVFDGMTMLDFAGPTEVLGRATHYELVLSLPRTCGSCRSSSWKDRRSQQRHDTLDSVVTRAFDGLLTGI